MHAAAHHALLILALAPPGLRRAAAGSPLRLLSSLHQRLDIYSDTAFLISLPSSADRAASVDSR